jgi:hypothetical protein
MAVMMPVTSPAHFLGLEAINLVARCHGRMGIFAGGRQSSALDKRLRRKRGGLRARGKGGRSGGKSKGEFQKTAAFHDISSFVESHIVSFAATR